MNHSRYGLEITSHSWNEFRVKCAVDGGHCVVSTAVRSYGRYRFWRRFRQMTGITLSHRFP